MKNSFIYESFHDREKPLRCFYSSNSNTNPHFHRCIEMLYITSGKAEGVVDGTRFFAEKDDIVFARRCAVHSYFARPHYHDIVLIVKEAYADDFAPVLEKATLPPLMADKKFNRTLLADFLRLYRLQGKDQQFLIKKGLVDVIFGNLLSHYPRQNIAPSTNLSTIVSVLGYIDKHFEEPITLDTIAAEFGYNKYYFSRLFNTYIGDSLNGYINMVRVNNVIARAKKSDDSLADIIFDCGFDSMTTFYRNYSRFYDRPPTEVIRT